MYCRPPHKTSSMNCSNFSISSSRLAKLLHRRRQPRTGTTFVAQAGDPDATVLRHDLVRLAIVAHHGRTAMKRIVRIVEPLVGEKKVAEIGDGLRLKV